MRSSGHDTVPGPRFGLAGAAAMVAVCVTTLALTAAGPSSSQDEAAGPPSVPQATSCEHCGRVIGAPAAALPGEAFGEPAVKRCGNCLR